MLSNRGASGIDGILHAALGAALASPQGGCTCLVGDVAALHDLSALPALAAAAPPLTVVILNNGGGGIFHYLLSQHSKVSADAPTAARFGNAELRACTLCWKDEAAGTLRLEADESVQPSTMSGV